MSELITLAKKVMKTVTRADSLLQAIDKADTIRIASRGLSLTDDIWEIVAKLLKPKEGGENE